MRGGGFSHPLHFIPTKKVFSPFKIDGIYYFIIPRLIRDIENRIDRGGRRSYSEVKVRCAQTFLILDTGVRRYDEENTLE